MNFIFIISTGPIMSSHSRAFALKHNCPCALHGQLRGDAPTGIRTPVLALKGPRPSPLDDGGVANCFAIGSGVRKRTPIDTSRRQTASNYLSIGSGARLPTPTGKSRRQRRSKARFYHACAENSHEILGLAGQKDRMLNDGHVGEGPIAEDGFADDAVNLQKAPTARVV